MSGRIIGRYWKGRYGEYRSCLFSKGSNQRFVLTHVLTQHLCFSGGIILLYCLHPVSSRPSTAATAVIHASAIKETQSGSTLQSRPLARIEIEAPRQGPIPGKQTNTMQVS